MMPDQNEGDSPAIWMLALGQTFGFASLFYIYGALLVWVVDDTGWDRSSLAIGLTLALIVSALTVSFSGRMVDRGLGAELLVGGAAFGGFGLLALSRVQTIVGWHICWALIGLAMSACLYDTCFAFLTRRLGTDARAAIIRVSLVAGLASTMAFPLGAVLAQNFGWRGAVVAFGSIQLFATVPLHFFAGRRLRRKERRSSKADQSDDGALGRAIRTRSFWLLAGAFGLAMMNHSMLVTYFISVFTSLGIAQAGAVAAASLVGPFQVIGRLALMLQGKRIGSLASTRGALIGMATASMLLMLAGIALPLIFVFSAVQGASIGMISILRPVLIAEVLGRSGFGAISGAIASVPIFATAAAPLVGAILLESGGTMVFLIASFLMASVALSFALILRGAYSE